MNFAQEAIYREICEIQYRLLSDPSKGYSGRGFNANFINGIYLNTAMSRVALSPIIAQLEEIGLVRTNPPFVCPIDPQDIVKARLNDT